MKMTRVGAVALVVAAAMAFTGCGRAAGDATATDEASTIGDAEPSGTITLWAMGAEGEALPDFVKAFEDEYPDVDVEVTAIPWDSAYSKIQTAIAGGTTPDIAQMGTTWMADFADSFQTVPSDFDTSDFFSGSLDSAQVGDRATGVPWYVDTRVLYYRTDLAEEAGWDSAPTTWDELAQMASDMQSSAGAEWGIRFPGGSGSFQSSLWMPWSNGADVDDGGSWTFDTSEMQKAYEYYQSFFTDGVADPDADTSSGAQEADFVSGDTPILIEGPFEVGQLNEIGGDGFSDKYATAVLPTEVSSTSFTGGSNLAVFNDSDNATSAWKLAQWLTQADTQADWYGATGDLPAVQSAWDDDALASQPSLAAFGTQLETAKSVPANTSWTKVSAAGDEVLEKIRRGTSSVEDALAELQSEADTIGWD